MTPDEIRTAADDLDRLEELEPRPGRVGLANRLRRGAEWMEAAREHVSCGERSEGSSVAHSVAEMTGLCPRTPNGQHSWLPWLKLTDRSWVTRCVACDRMEQWDG